LLSSERGNYTRFKTIDIDNDCVYDAIGTRDNSTEATEAGTWLLTALDLNSWVSIHSFIKEYKKLHESKRKCLNCLCDSGWLSYEPIYCCSNDL